MAGKMCVFCGSNQPQKAFAPFMLSAGALATDMEVTLFFTMDGLDIVRRGGAEQIRLEGAAKTLSEYLQLVKDGGGKLIACSAAFPIVNCTKDDLIDGVECGGITSFLGAAEKADLVLTFA